jgi:sulfite exporter TauE/SafE
MLSISRNSAVLSVSGVVGLLYSVRELGLFQVPVLQSTWQVPEVWRRVLPSQVASLLYGLGLGVGVATRIPVGTFYVTVVWAVLASSPLLGALGMAAFGLGRALPLLWMAGLFNSNEEAFRLMSVLPRWQPAVHIVNGLALGFAGSCLLAAALALHQA